MPPSRTEIGSTLHQPNGEVRSGVRFSTGAHWASATTRRSEDYDIGAGYVYERVDAQGGDITSKRDPGVRRDDARTSQGAYLSVARVLSRDLSGNHRTWLGVRGEYLHASASDGGPSVGVLARADWEVFGEAIGAGASSSSCGGAVGMAYGIFGLGLYAEGGARRSLEGEASAVATAGVSLRLPFLAGFGFSLCGK